MDPSQQYLDPQTLARIKDLELQSRQIVEGLVSGTHKSPYQGVSIEFAEHREYVPGDDVRHIDWKVFAKTEKIYLKRFEQETNLVCNFALDASESMSYASGETSKLAFASRMVAALAYMVIHQQDSAGFALFDDQMQHLIQASSQPSQLKHIFQLISTCKPGSKPGRIGNMLDELAARLRRRSLVMVFSDCFDDLNQIITGLKHLKHKRHEVVVFQVLDSAELEFEFQQTTLFRGLEAMPEIMADPRAYRKGYLEAFGSFLQALKVACRSTNVDYQLVRTDQPLDLYLAGYLASRLNRLAASGASRVGR